MSPTCTIVDNMPITGPTVELIECLLLSSHQFIECYGVSVDPIYPKSDVFSCHIPWNVVPNVPTDFRDQTIKTIGIDDWNAMYGD